MEKSGWFVEPDNSHSQSRHTTRLPKSEAKAARKYLANPETWVVLPGVPAARDLAWTQLILPPVRTVGLVAAAREIEPGIRRDGLARARPPKGEQGSLTT
jgi:hypothetical protein